MGESADPARPGLEGPALVAWAMALAWAGFVWGLGTDDFSNDQTGSFLGPLLDWLFSGLDAAGRARIHWAIRKSAHAVEYGIWAALLLRALWLSRVREARRLAAWTLAAVLALGVSDELRQGLSATREGSAWDALLDLAGGAAVVAAILAAPPGVRRWWLPAREGDARDTARGNARDTARGDA